MSESISERAKAIPRWALERADTERARFIGARPNPINVDVWLRAPESWTTYLAFADYIARTADEDDGHPGSSG